MFELMCFCACFPMLMRLVPDYLVCCLRFSALKSSCVILEDHGGLFASSVALGAVV